MIDAIADVSRAAFNQVEWPIFGISVAVILLFWLLRARELAVEQRDLYRKGFQEFGRHKKGCEARKTNDQWDCECGYADLLRRINDD